MRNYGSVSPRFWTQGTGKALRGDAEAQLVALYLITSPHSTAWGIFHCPALYIAHETGLSIEGASKGLRRLIEGGFCEYDEASEMVFVVQMARYQIAESLQPRDKRVPWLWKEIEKLPKHWKTRFLAVHGCAFSLIDRTTEVSPIEGPSEPHRSHEHEHEHEQDRKSMSTSSTDPVDSIFDHWRTVHEHPKAVLDKKRRALIRSALKSYDEQQLKDSISGYKNSPHHTGVNERNTPYDTIELMLRDAKHIDMGLKFHTNPPSKAAAAKQLTAKEMEWHRLREDARLEQFREPMAGESLQDFRAALKEHANRRGREAIARLGVTLGDMSGALRAMP